MDEEVDRLVIGVRADTQAFARDVATLRATLDGPFGTGVARAGRQSVMARHTTVAMQAATIAVYREVLG